MGEWGGKIENFLVFPLFLEKKFKNITKVLTSVEQYRFQGK